MNATQVPASPRPPSRPQAPPAHGQRGSPVTYALIAITCAVFAVQYYNVAGYGQWLYEHFALWPPGGPDAVRVGGRMMRVPPFDDMQLFTYGFLHASPTHLFFNMFALWMFGRAIERWFGSLRFGAYYLLCTMGAALTQIWWLSQQSTLGGPTVGASGATFGVLLAYGVMFPNQRLMLLIPPIPIKAKYFVLLYGALELAFGVTGTWEGVAHFAHLGGMLAGLIVILIWRVRRPPGRAE